MKTVKIEISKQFCGEFQTETFYKTCSAQEELVVSARKWANDNGFHFGQWTNYVHLYQVKESGYGSTYIRIYIEDVKIPA